jgi:hypothetical protein
MESSTIAGNRLKATAFMDLFYKMSVRSKLLILTVSCFRSPMFRNFRMDSVSCLLKNL